MITGTSGRLARTSGSISSPLMPGILMSDRIRISEGSPTSTARSIAASAEGRIPCETVPSADRGGIADGTALPHQVRHRRRGYRRSMRASSISFSRQLARQRNDEFGKNAGLSIDINFAAMLFHHDVVAHRQPKPGALAGGLGGEERIEHLLPHLGRNAGAVVPNPDFDTVAEVFRHRAERRLKAVACGLLALGRGVKSVGNQVEENSGDLLRIEVYHTGGRIELVLEGNVEAGSFRARAVIGEVEALFHDGVDIDGPMLAASLARMQQHVLDDRVGPLAMLDDLLEVAFEHAGQLVDLLPHLVVEGGG